MNKKRNIERAIKFCSIWNSCRTLKEVCAQMRMSRSRASNRASYYRRNKIKLKFFPKRVADVFQHRALINRQITGLNS